MSKWLHRLKVKLGIWQTKPTEEVKRLIESAMQVEEQEACEHKMLISIMPNDMWYRCTNCNLIWFMPYALLWSSKKTPELIKTLNKVTKYNPKVKKTAYTDFVKETKKDK